MQMKRQKRSGKNKNIYRFEEKNERNEMENKERKKNK